MGFISSKEENNLFILSKMGNNLFTFIFSSYLFSKYLFYNCILYLIHINKVNKYVLNGKWHNVEFRIKDDFKYKNRHDMASASRADFLLVIYYRMCMEYNFFLKDVQESSRTFPSVSSKRYRWL